MADQSFGYDRGSQRFRDLQTGKFVSERSVRDAVDAVADLASRRMGESAARYRAGQISVSTWLAESQQVIKDSQIASALLAYGGRAQMDAQKWGAVGAAVKTQYLYARQMVADVLDGRQPANGRLDARSRQYGQAARSLYENIRRREGYEVGFRFERNVRHSSEACSGCVAATDAGVVPAGTLPPIGSRQCRMACRCTIARYRTMSEAA